MNMARKAARLRLGRIARSPSAVGGEAMLWDESRTPVECFLSSKPTLVRSPVVNGARIPYPAIMKKNCSVFLVAVLCLGSSAFAKSAGDAFSIHDPKGKQVIGTADVTCASLEKDAAGKDVATFKVQDGAAAKLREVTKNNIGKTMAVFVCGRKIKEPKIAAEITGKTVMATGLEPKDKECLSKAFQLKEKCEG
ncbi:MAG: hypothetical protein NDJ89_13015 [Oligoflexia bacterium]|nr:hypothetical protein [Oligoflexia bacterium]